MTADERISESEEKKGEWLKKMVKKMHVHAEMHHFLSRKIPEIGKNFEQLIQDSKTFFV